MRLMAVDHAFLAQAQALMHTETMLFIDHDQRQRGKLDAFLKQRMRADDNGRMAQTNSLEHGAARLAGLASAQQCDGYT
jgi:hypothetical protein